ncbi:ABC transporter ATP-binding protein [Eggerthellaceae bacterium zg-1084]|uniref:ABC transporter ATP-binding protein n=1 Tax=Berryella wangjianweii TaxID=2734634 RepID=UPI001554A4BE|nr:ABC transporter ATP-binding protein [Berryella wangjianweii]NPD31353.1 ABC transporter ATP-binding protein [Berryella wangjianweii]
MAPSFVLEARGLSKTYGKRGGGRKGGFSQTAALRDVSLAVAEGEMVAIMGASGSGKSTLLNCISTIDRPDEGTVLIDGRDIGRLKGAQLASFRSRELGFVFQDANLLDTLTCFENIALSLTIRKVPAREIDTRVRYIADQLSIGDVLGKFPYQVSGGQKQRVAIARAMVGKPRLVLADEPTGALDSKSARQLLESLERINRLGATVVMVTHDPVSASYFHRVVFIKDGRLAHQAVRGDADRESFYSLISDTIARLGKEADHVR